MDVQYPYLCVFADEDKAYRYVVRANDCQQAVLRARKLYESDPERGPGLAASLARAMNLQPKQRDGMFVPRIDGRDLGLAPQKTPKGAVDAALEWLSERSAR
jgi:hypothetical protein